MKQERGSKTLIIRRGSRLCFSLALILLLLALLCWFPLPRLSACAMSALISVQRSTLDDFPSLGSAANYTEYNDPWDYFAFVMANSTPYLNSDGYGVVAYRDGNPVLRSREMWYKRVTTPADFNATYYTGQYLEQGGQNLIWNHDVLDAALFGVQSGSGSPAIVLCHARNATGLTYGNHPFWFELGGRTFTFMHNGFCNSARAFMINRINQLNPGVNWFALHPSNHFGNANPLQWVDTEVFFHYLMCHISASQNDVLYGLNNALARLRPYLLNYQTGIFNFVMSDGSRLYVFRNSPTEGSSHQLSYKVFPGQFIAVRTQYPGPRDIELKPLELVVLSRSEAPAHFRDFTLPAFEPRGIQPETAACAGKPGENTPAVLAGPNPFSGSTTLRIRMDGGGLLTACIYNSRGERVWQEERYYAEAGIAALTWNGIDRRGKPVPSGVYIIQAEIGRQVHTARVVLVRRD